ncbi:MAG: phosphopantothenoylcysteine decarboxylase [Phycisphaerales bacterium]|nr:phosphopantothenoylcysteine decarboxylase [Phycisphaerales bacterium]
MTNPANPNAAAEPVLEWAGYEIVVAVCGGIAAYKVATVVSGLVQQGAGVTVVMTSAAQRFVTPLTFESLTARQVFTGLWDESEKHDPQHLTLTEAADLFIVAPATANMIGKIAHGLADDLVSTMVMSAACPVLLAPAMNTRMWNNPIVEENLGSLKRLGYLEVPPEEGWLACRTVGAGRMAEPETILESARVVLDTPPKKGR